MSPLLSPMPGTGLPDVSVLPVVADDGAKAELYLQRPAGPARHLLYWLPAMGVPAKHYLPLAQALAVHGVAMAVHEWRGIGSSEKRAGRHSDWAYRDILAGDLPAGLAAAREGVPQATSVWLGGHSLGGQLACLYASLHADSVAGIALVASGAPYWKCFRYGALLTGVYALASPLAHLLGYFPGRRLGFGGNEARGMIADWARSGRRGRYAAAGMPADFEALLAAFDGPVLGLRMRDDSWAPQASLEWLLGKLPRSAAEMAVLAPPDLEGHPAGHFEWMQAPQPVAVRIARWIEVRAVSPVKHPASGA